MKEPACAVLIHRENTCTIASETSEVLAGQTARNNGGSSRSLASYGDRFRYLSSQLARMHVVGSRVKVGGVLVSGTILSAD